MSTDGFDGMPQLQEDLKRLPEKVQKRIASVWVKKWAVIAKMNAIREAPIGKTRNLVSGIVNRVSSKTTLGKYKSFARSVVIGKKPAFHFHLVNLGTKPRYTGAQTSKGKGGRVREKSTGKKRAFRGAMPANPFIARAAPPILAQAEADFRQLVSKEIHKFIRKNNGG